MKIVCDCGNEMEFIEESEICNDEGIYTNTDNGKFEFWSAHDQCGIVCNKCKKAIWLFT